jgi:iron complex outermembrane receptor protein
LLVLPAIAQTTTPSTDSENVVKLQDFVVVASSNQGYGQTTAYTATRIGIPIIKTPINVQVVTDQLMSDQGVRDFQGALKFVSGVAGAGPLALPPGTSGFLVRGFTPTLFLRNGFRRPGNLVIENVDRLEIIKGPASVFFGQAAPGGLINVITRKPSERASASLEYTYGSYDFQKTRLDVTGPLGQSGVSYRLFASYEDSEDWRDWVMFRNTVIAPSIRWKASPRLSFTVDYEYSENKRNYPPYTAIGNRQFIADYENPPPEAQAKLGLSATQLRSRWRTAINTWINDRKSWTGVEPFRITDYITDISPRGLRYNSGGPEQEFRNSTDNVSFEGTFELNNLISFRYGGSYYDMNSFTLRSGLAVTNADKTINLALSSPREMDRWLIHQVDVLFKYDVSFVKSKVVVGYQHTYNRYVQDTAVFNTAAAPGGAATVLEHNAYTMSDILLSQVPATLTTLTSDRNQRNTTKGYAASWFAEWFNGSRLTTLVGLRREQDIRKRVGLPVLADLNRTATTPTFGATYQFKDGFSAFASYSENFSPNSVRTRTGPGLLPSDNAADLPVEVGKGKDIGIKTDWMNNRLSGSLSLYEVERSSVPRADRAGEVADPRNINGLTTPGSVRYNVAGGVERTRGGELDLVYAPTPNYNVVFTATYMWEAKVIKDPSAVPGTIAYERIFNQGRRLANTPKYMAGLWNKYDFTTGPLKGLTTGLGIRYASKNEPRATDSTSLLVNPGYTLVSALVGYRTRIGGRNVAFSVNVDNLFDKLYFDGASGVGDARKIFLKTRIEF